MKIPASMLFACLLIMPQGTQPPRILGIAHMALFVSDVERSLAFYRDFLGYQEPYRLNKSDGSLHLTFIKVNDYQYLELFPGLQPESDRLNHIAFYTDDLEALRAYLGGRGVKVPERVSKGRIGNLSFNVKDPDGHTVEFVQYQPQGWSMREKGKFMGEARASARLRHLGVAVANLEAANRFYGEILGFTETWRGSSSGTVLSWVNMKVPDGDDYLEYMLYKDPPSLARLGVMNHICLETPDMGRALSQLEASPYRKGYSREVEARMGKNRRRLSNLYDPDGTRVELMEPRTVDGVPTPSSTAPPPL